jgi:hypothetical protein
MSEDDTNLGTNNSMGTPRTSIEATPRAAANDLPVIANGGIQNSGNVNRSALESRQIPQVSKPPAPGSISPNQVARTITVGTMSRRRSFYLTDNTPYREEDVLLSLQLLAYLSKYLHVRQAFYQPRNVVGTGDSVIKTAGTYLSQASSARSKDRKGLSFFKFTENFTKKRLSGYGNPYGSYTCYRTSRTKRFLFNRAFHISTASFGSQFTIASFPPPSRDSMLGWGYYAQCPSKR